MTNREVATFAGGCFWGVEHLFRQIAGVSEAISGYIGGATDDPSYRDVCSGATGHAEAVQVTFDPDQVSYEELVHLFWEIHDPTTLNRQGPDLGTQYRSEIFTHSAKQAELAIKSKDWAQQFFALPIVTEISPADRFYPAEEYHQEYFTKNGGHGCHIRRPIGR